MECARLQQELKEAKGGRRKIRDAPPELDHGIQEQLASMTADRDKYKATVDLYINEPADSDQSIKPLSLGKQGRLIS